MKFADNNKNAVEKVSGLRLGNAKSVIKQHRVASPVVFITFT